ncbi:hypothetical protein HYW83_05340 [Candidatus Peregrinibacteria bacterium]|nr:hypothetical protein [Candidatus Peregrinibacteria bacterium]
MSWAKFQAIFAMIIMAVVGILQLVVFSSLSSVMTSIGGEQAAGFGGMIAGIGFVGLLIGIPVAGAVGFVGGLVGGWLCNVVLKWIGGIKLELSHG